MTLITKRSGRALVAAASAIALAGGAGLAGAQIPGGGTGGAVVKVDSEDLLVTVNDKGAAPEVVTGSIQNTSGAAYRCGTPGLDMEGEMPGQVTTAGVVQTAVEYYANNIYTGPEAFNIPDAGPVGMGSAFDLIPAGSAVGSAEVDTRTPQQQARVDGRTGDPRVGANHAFTVPAGGTLDWNAVLAPPATGDRGDWQAAAMFYCINQTSGEHFVFYGYEDYEPADDGVPETTPEETGSLDFGSLGGSVDS